MKEILAKVLMTALVLALVLSMTAFSFAASPLALPSDVDESLAPAVQALIDKGAVTGDTDGLFHPEANLTRAQVCCMLIKLINPASSELGGTTTVAPAENGFPDMGGYGWAKPYIDFAAKYEIAKGYSDGTFKPGNKVTVAELLTFTLRSCGYKDSDLAGKWPANYIAKATELGLLAGNENADTSAPATKAQAASVIYNAIELVTDPSTGDTPQGTDKENPDDIPDTASYTYAYSSFSSDMSAYDKYSLASNAKIYTYGVRSDYKQGMTFSKDKADYRETTVYKYKGASTPAWYKLEKGKIVSMIVPGDTGFGGRIYCVINAADTTVLNYDDKAVTGITTLTAGREIMWFADEALTASGIPAKAAYLAGKVYELQARAGEIKAIAEAGAPEVKGYFKEIGTTGLTTIDAVDSKLIEVGGKWYSVNDKAVVYVLEDDEYKAGSFSAAKAGLKVRLYDISDDDVEAADIVLIKK